VGNKIDLGEDKDTIEELKRSGKSPVTYKQVRKNLCSIIIEFHILSCTVCTLHNQQLSSDYLGGVSARDRVLISTTETGCVAVSAPYLAHRQLGYENALL